MKRIKNISLSSLQNNMQQALLTSSLKAHQQSFITTEIQSSPRMSAKAHFGIYQRSYITRLQQCMGSQFSALKFALGDNIFQLFVRQYLQTYPSKHYSLNNLGDDFSQFLAQTRPDAQDEVKEQWPDFMIELAAFESSLNLLFDLEPPNTIPDHEQIQANLATTDSQLRLVPVLKLFCHKHPIFDYYRAFIAQQNPEVCLPKTSYGLLIRRHYRLGLIDLNRHQYLFIKHLLTSQNIETAKQALIKSYNEDQTLVTNLWQNWRKYLIEKGVFNQSAI